MTKNLGYPLASSTWDESDLSALQDVISSGNLTMGKEVRAFEKEFAKYFGVKHAVMVNSGSSANLLAIASLTYKRNRPLIKDMEIIVPSVSWSTTYYPVHQYGMKLRFVDINLLDLNINIELVRQAISKETGAIFAVNLLGQAAELAELRKLADEHGIYLIEDNCESMGAMHNGKYAGTWGELGTFSFYFSHHINTIEGGMIVTDDDELKDILVSLRAHGWTRELPDENYVYTKTGTDWEDYFRFVLPGYNLRPTEIQGVLGQTQLKSFARFLDQRIKNHTHFKRIFGNLKYVKIQSGTGVSSAFGFAIILEPEVAYLRNKIVTSLLENGIESRPIVAGNFLKNPVIKLLNVGEVGNFPVADAIHDAGFFLGNHHFAIYEEIEGAYSLIKGILEE